MKRFILLLTISFSASTVFSQTEEQVALKKTLDAFLLAIKNNDAAAAGPLLVSEYKLYGGFSCITNKNDRLACLKAGQIKYGDELVYTAGKFSVNIYGGSIQLNTPLKYTACSQDGKEQTIQDCPVIIHFIKQEGSWRIDSECLGGSCLH